MPRPKATEGRMFASVAPREELARLRRGVAKSQVKPLIGASDPYRVGSPFPSRTRKTSYDRRASVGMPPLAEYVRHVARLYGLPEEEPAE
jgi:hypothetical protein